ncbi:MAG: dCTP deaminase [Patescibacteria group bacterium]|nr:dCTP deaminase [Patescibacteria group bacterium]
MVLSKRDILNKIKEGGLKFEPNIDKFQLQPNGVDLRLGWSFYSPKEWTVNDQGRTGLNVDYTEQASKDSMDLIKLQPGQYFELLPKEFVIASTLEKISLEDDSLMAMLYARSSLIRRGLLIFSGTIDSHYRGYMAIPIVNNTNTQTIRLYPGERACQLVFHLLSSPLTEEEEAQKHGLKKAKYQESAPYSLAAKSDGQEEIDLIRKGKLNELKNNFKV